MTQRKQSFTSSGNATVYVLIVVALFAALAIIVSRQNDTSEQGRLSSDRANIIATQVLTYPYQVKQSVEMMLNTGTDSSSLDFTLPGQPGFDTAPYLDKIFHPEGGGMVQARLPEPAIVAGAVTPPAGWYLGMFNNFEWSETTEPDVVLVAYPLSQAICEAINLTMIGTSTPPVLSNTIQNVFIDREYPNGNAIHGGSNDDLDVGNCPGCEDQPSLCVIDSNGRYGFYSLIVNR